MKTNITFICLLNHFSKNIGKLLCEKLDMYFVDVEDMINFELGDTNHILTVLGNKEGKKYMKDTERFEHSLYGLGNGVTAKTASNGIEKLNGFWHGTGVKTYNPSNL